MPDPISPPAAVDPVSAVEAARTFEALALALETLFADVGAWVRDSADPSVAVALATVSRRLGEQAVAWRALVPESVLLADARAAAHAAAAAGSVWGAAGVPRPGAGDAERVRLLRSVLADLGAHAAALAVRLSPVADGAAARQASVLAVDLAAADGALAGSAGPVTTDG